MKTADPSGCPPAAGAGRGHQKTPVNSGTEFTDEGVVFKRTKSWAFLAIDHSFRAIRRQVEKVFAGEGEDAG